METAEGRNQTPISEFILLGFGNGPKLQPLLSLLFLVIYLVTAVGNLLIVGLVVTDRHLHTPMYFLVGNLSWLETCYSSAILPRLLASLLTGNRTIAIKGCIVQLYVFGTLTSTENMLLAAMSYDRYVAICHPLRYPAMMTGRVCFWLVVGAWTSSLLLSSIVDSWVFQLTFCGSNEIDHFFCDFSPIIKLSCSDTCTLELVTFVVTAIGSVVPFLLLLISYFFIISTIMRIPSSTGRQKAFSTCSSHLIVLVILHVSTITVYLVPAANTPRVLHKIFSVCYTVLPPLANPFIYSLRNEEVSESLRKALLKLSDFGHRHRI